jgi:uncharacterized protein
VKRPLLWAISRYRATGGGKRWFGVECNFEPSCSAYTHTAISRFGARKGVSMGWQRIRRCSQRDSFCKCIEPVPEPDHVKSTTG